jgi:hypothetical protein
MTKPMSLEEIKGKIDGYHFLQAEGHLSEGDCVDAINDLIGRPNGENASIYDDLRDYKYESYCNFGLKDW